MFLDNLYTVVESGATESTISARIKLDSDHHLFEGHFPGSPVMPGVVQLQIVREILEVHFQQKLKMTQMRTCKFLQIINPREAGYLQIEAKFKHSEVLDITMTISYNETVYLKAQATYCFA